MTTFDIPMIDNLLEDVRIAWMADDQEVFRNLLAHPTLVAWKALSNWDRKALREDYKDELRRQEMAGWTTKVLSAFSEDEADTKTVCFRPLGDGTVRVWNSQVYASRMTDRDYDPVKDNYDGAYGNDLDVSETLPIAVARKRWAEMVKQVAYKDEFGENVMMYVPAGAY